MTGTSGRTGSLEWTSQKPGGVPSNRLVESVLAAFAAIRANKVRSLLTSLGIMIGVMNVVAMVSLISGVNESVMDVFRQMGTNTFVVSKMPAANVDYMQYLEYLRRPDFTFRDAEAVEELCPSVLAVSPQSVVARRVRRGSESTAEIRIVGVSPEYQYVSDSAVERGRFFAWPEADRRRQVVVLGAPVEERLFPGDDPVGENVLIGGHRFRVVGVMEPQGEMFGQSLDNYVMVPFRTLNKLFGSRLSSSLSVKTVSGERIEPAMEEVERVMRGRRGLRAGDPNNFEIISQSQLVEMYENLTRVTWIVMIGISAIALVVGGVGIMNIMLVSVTERTKEIGIRKAVGARSRDVAAQFLVEAGVLSGIGGLLGLLAALGIGAAIEKATPLPATPQPWSILLALGVSIGVGVFFGFFPATKAAKLDPIVALRYE
ncbi:MAG: FtsX-like permease family protein [Candidatus Eisenbacteria bacterium]|nr:FtsX-like permease family protein [Candidatus Eisenbacteria bacterium]